MFGISFGEIILICVVALILFGPEKLPEIARSLGKILGELRRNSDRLKREFYSSIYAPPRGPEQSPGISINDLTSRETGEPRKPLDLQNELTLKGAKHNSMP